MFDVLLRVSLRVVPDLTTIMLLADVNPIDPGSKPPPKPPVPTAEATIIESNVVEGEGKTLLLILHRGILRVGESFVTDRFMGKIRSIQVSDMRYISTSSDWAGAAKPLFVHFQTSRIYDEGSTDSSSRKFSQTERYHRSLNIRFRVFRCSSMWRWSPNATSLLSVTPESRLLDVASSNFPKTMPLLFTC